MKIKLHVKSKAALIFIIIGIILISAVGYATYSLNYRQAAKQYTDLALSSARMAASIVTADGGKIDGYIKDGKNGSYEDIYQKLQTLKISYNLEYLYIIRPDTDKNDGVYIFDVYTGENNPDLIAEIGEKTGEMDVYDIVLKTYLTGNSTDSAIITNTEYGYLASAYAPVYAPDGSITAVAGADISMNIVLGDVKTQTVQILIVLLAIIALSLFCILIIIRRQILNPIVRLSSHMETFAGDDGDFKEFPVPNTGDELQTVSESFNRMVGDLRLYMENLTAVTADRERIATELNVAKKIQSGMLPCIFPPFPERTEFDLYASMQPAKEVGGDFYDFFLVDENTLAVVIADVSGKGVPAALFMVIAKTLIKNNAQSGKNPKEVFEAVNNILCENNDAGMFVTAILGYLDIPAGRFDFINAGHNPPLLCTGGQYNWLKMKSGFILAGMEHTVYKQHEVILNPGDRLFLYTDGVTEAVDPSQKLFGETRLINTINGYIDLPLREFTEAVKSEIDKFARDAEQADDITMLTLRYKGEKQKEKK